MRVLFLSPWFPYPPNNGSKLRILNLLRGLATRHEVTLLAFADQPGADPTVPELRSLCREVRVIPRRAYNPNGVKARLGFLSPLPRSLLDTYSPQIANLVRKAAATSSPDLAIASQLGAAIYADCLDGVPGLFEEVEVAGLYERYARSRTLWGRLRHGLTWVKHRRYLASLLRKYSRCTVASEQEKALLSGIAAGYEPIDVVPNCVDLADYEKVEQTPQPGTLIFTGSFRYLANHEAMIWFLDKVFPLVQRSFPGATLTITGDHADLPLPAAENVTLTGYVDDVRPLVAGAWVSLAPILGGGGTRLKILEAMALGTPVVATSKGAEGLDVRDGEHLLVADTPAAFAQAIVSVLGDSDLRQRLADGAYRLVREKYDWAVVLPRFLDLAERTARPASAGRSGDAG